MELKFRMVDVGYKKIIQHFIQHDLKMLVQMLHWFALAFTNKKDIIR